jgi:hypothetical protein
MTSSLHPTEQAVVVVSWGERTKSKGRGLLKAARRLKFAAFAPHPAPSCRLGFAVSDPAQPCRGERAGAD